MAERDIRWDRRGWAGKWRDDKGLREFGRDAGTKEKVAKMAGERPYVQLDGGIYPPARSGVKTALTPLKRAINSGSGLRVPGMDVRLA